MDETTTDKAAMLLAYVSSVLIFSISRGLNAPELLQALRTSAVMQKEIMAFFHLMVSKPLRIFFRMYAGGCKSSPLDNL